MDRECGQEQMDSGQQCHWSCHEWSVGSLGKDGGYATVENVYVSNCSFFGTTNGLRIKTWQNGYGFVRNVTYNNIRLQNTRNPIIIDQNYRDLVEDFPIAKLYEMMMQGKGIEIIGVTYKDVSGTSATSVAINLGCNSSEGCSNIIMDRVNLTSVSPSEKVIVLCSNVKGQETTVSPKVSCLTEKLPSTLIGSHILFSH
ncbi:hypothetical protein TanjilG_21518 [Lupinus angustifolius]|uniref:Polygalacturonase n=1 Tax=Lupinus angustifolius TaxID=3871 RepID=A0A4P1QUB1_LUPAN|nr:hypothetical protein TanjilG_21518 [Lupinus angustifolius]